MCASPMYQTDTVSVWYIGDAHETHKQSKCSSLSKKELKIGVWRCPDHRTRPTPSTPTSPTSPPTTSPPTTPPPTTLPPPPSPPPVSPAPTTHHTSAPPTATPAPDKPKPPRTPRPLRQKRLATLNKTTPPRPKSLTSFHQPPSALPSLSSQEKDPSPREPAGQMPKLYQAAQRDG